MRRIALLSIALCACSTRSMSPAAADDDRALVEAVQRAAQENASPEVALARVGRKPTIDTRNARGRAGFQAADLVTDPGAQPARELRAAATVLYWVRPVEAQNPRVVALAWGADGRVRVHFVTVLTP